MQPKKIQKNNYVKDSSSCGGNIGSGEYASCGGGGRQTHSKKGSSHGIINLCLSSVSSNPINF